MTDQLGLFQKIDRNQPGSSAVTSTVNRPDSLSNKPAVADPQSINEADRSKSPDTYTDLKWKELLKEELSSDYFLAIRDFIKSERARGKIIYPPDHEIFSALHHTPLAQIKVVILGQDPYHGPGQAHGLCFSVKPGVPAPPSLQNIFLEIERDLKIRRPNHGCLIKWAQQGVLLLNAVLTVEANRAASHANRGWERFTDKIISIINEHCTGIVFLLWGSYAQKKGAIIDRAKHHVLSAPHPSPLSAHRGFLGCKHFSEANRLLGLQGKREIDWAL